MKNKEPESSPLPSKVEEITGSFYKPIAALVTTCQMSVEDWGLGPMSKKNRREIYNRVERHNDNLRNVAIELKNQFESLKAKSPDSPSQPSKVEKTAGEILEKHIGHLDYYKDTSRFISAMEEYASQFKFSPHSPSQPSSISFSEEESQAMFSIKDMRAAFYAGRDATADEYRSGESVGFDEWLSTRKKGLLIK